ncbi:MAG: hydantoinase/oxoprolinase family protein [Chloroflexota bacterium]
MSICLGIDVGGTFTDIAILEQESGAMHVQKVSSTPHDPAEGIFAGIEQALALLDRQTQDLVYLAHGTTVGINALLQEQGANVLLFTTAGFRDLLEIRRQKRPDLYDLFADKPTTLIPRERRFEVPERVDATGAIVQPLDEKSVIQLLRDLQPSLAESPEAIAVCLLFSFLNPSHEEHLQTLLQEYFPDTYITISAAVVPEFREFERLGTTVLNACLGPVMARYLTTFVNRVQDLGIPARPYIAQSNGGILSVDQAIRLPVRTIASGPSAGVIGAIQVAQASGLSNLLTFDMGGTSTDVCLVKDGEPLVTTNRSVAGLPVKSPMIDIHSIGAGGGSIAWIDEAGALWVGPQSAGAYPGPACYSQGGELPTVTDANVVLGRLNPLALLDGALPIAYDQAFAALTTHVATPLNCSVAQAAAGVLEVVSASMTRALRLISVERGEDPADFTVVAFGGAGPLHATMVAESVGCRRVLVPPNPGILCGIGLLLSAPRMDFVRTRRLPLSDEQVIALAQNLNALVEEATDWFEQEAIPSEARTLLQQADIRYRRQNFELTIDVPMDHNSSPTVDVDVLSRAFHQAYEKQYGYAMPDEPLDVINLRVTAMGQQQTSWQTAHQAANQTTGELTQPQDSSPEPTTTRLVWFNDTMMQTPIYRRTQLRVDQFIEGPAIIEQYDSTTVLPPRWLAVSDAVGNLILTYLEEG